MIVTYDRQNIFIVQATDSNSSIIFEGKAEALWSGAK